MKQKITSFLLSSACLFGAASLALFAPSVALADEDPLSAFILNNIGPPQATENNTQANSNATTLNSGDVLLSALGLIGVRYTFGGNTPDSGFDCSGFVRYVFQQSMGIALPRSAAEISRVGDQISETDLQPGDLVFYNTMSRAFSHVGIYMGNGKFIHSPRTGKSVQVVSMRDSYWEKRFNGARRITTQKP